MFDFEWLHDVVGVVVGVSGTVTGVIIAVFGYAKTAQAERDKAMAARKDALVQMTNLDERVSKVEGELRSGFDDIFERTSSLEKSMETVARQGDIVKMSGELGGLQASVNASTRQISMLYEAALSREKSGN